MDPSTYGNDQWLGQHMELVLTHRRLIDDVEARDVEQWRATGTIDATDLEDGVDEEKRIDVVEVHMVRCQLGNPNLWLVLDGLEADLATVGSAVLDPDTGEIADAVSQHDGIGSDLLILNSVVCDERFAGRQIGRWVAAEALEALNGRSELEATMAAPLGSAPEGPERARISARLRQVWSSIGFVAVDDEVMVRNPDLMTSYTGLKDLRERFGEPTGM